MGLQFSLSLSAMGNCIRSMLRKLRRNRAAEKYVLFTNDRVSGYKGAEVRWKKWRLFCLHSRFVISGPSSCSLWDWTMPGSPRYWITSVAVSFLRIGNRYLILRKFVESLLLCGIDVLVQHASFLDSDQNVLPTIGFRTVSIKYKSYSTKIYDLGGSSQIRALWPKYYNDVSDEWIF